MKINYSIKEIIPWKLEEVLTQDFLNKTQCYNSADKNSPYHNRSGQDYNEDRKVEKINKYGWAYISGTSELWLKPKHLL